MQYNNIIPYFFNMVRNGIDWCGSVLTAVPWVTPLLLGVFVSSLAISLLVVPAIGIGFRGVSSSERNKR